jgi:asparagine synthase (glutamine-hydrolysing)
MCGIAGIARFHAAQQGPLIDAMVEALRHRGPDDDGVIEFAADGTVLGMTRLSILDIDGGHQPMSDEAARYALVFNGEIYNFRDLWPELVQLGHRFATDHSDTEVIVHGFEEWGTGLFARLNGMFSIAIWDTLEKRLTLARDRTGEKPLYLGRLNDGGWAFASELKALLLLPDLDRSIDLGALEQYLAFDFVMGPRTMLRSVQKLRAGHFAEISAEGIAVEPFWIPSFETIERAPEVIVEELDELLDRSVRLRLVADVPVGLFLSGGLDSTTIGYYMARAQPGVRSFSIGFEDPAFDESAEARMAANHLGIDHELHVFSEGQVRDLVPQVTTLLDEPMGDQSIFPTYLLCAMAREHVKVALGGDGSDELFMGYRTYQVLKVAAMVDGSPLDPIVRAIGGLLPATGPRLLSRLHQFGRTLDRSPEERLLSRLGSFRGDSRWVLAPTVRESLGLSPFDDTRAELARSLDGHTDAATRTIGTYLRGYLQEDILVKVDRASMAASLEVRSPFLDPTIIDFALSIPPDAKLVGMRRKDPLRRLMRGRIPDRLIDRPKRGFGAPVSAWLRGPLRPLVDDYLSPERLASAGQFDQAAVRSVIERHRSGNDDAGNQLWLLLQFEMWRERWITGNPALAETSPR